MRIAFIGCVEGSHNSLKRVLAHEDAEVVGVVTREASPFNADFRSLAPLAEKHGVPCFMAEGNNQAEMAAWLRERQPDVIYCFGWSYLLGPEVLEIAPLGVIGAHPTALPKNRGRHPLIWALALGLKETASTFFFMDEGADSGDILSQETLPIHEDDDARTLYDRLMEISARQIDTFTAQLASGDYPRRPQDDSRANYWRKRSKADGRMDWRMSSRSLYNLVRALARPYPGAHFDVGDQEVKVWRAALADSQAGDLYHIEPGKVLAVENGSFVVKCGEGALRVLEWDAAFVPEPGADTDLL